MKPVETAMTVTRAPVIRFNELYLELSNVCNAECAHCYVSSGPGASRTRLEPDVCRELIAAAAASDIVAPRVVLAGGEPTLRWPEMIEILRAAREHGMTSGIITNGWWGRTGKTARARAAELATAGIGTVEVSVSAFHREFVPPASVQRVLDALAEQKIQTTLLVRYDTERSSLTLLNQFDERHGAGVVAGPVTFAGRGAGLAPSLVPHWEVAGPPEGTCSHDLSLTVTPVGNVYPCCCGSENTSGLMIGNVYETPLAGILARIASRPAIGCLATMGPAELVRMLAASGHDVSWAEAGRSTICDLCVDMFNRPAVVAAVDAVAAEYVAGAPTGVDVDRVQPTDELFEEALRTGTVQPSGARLLRAGRQFVKIGTGSTADRLRQQVAWLRRVGGSGAAPVPEVLAEYGADAGALAEYGAEAGAAGERDGATYGYAMSAHNKIAVPSADRVPALIRLLLDHLEAIWRLPAPDVPPADLPGYTARVAGIVEVYDRELAARFRATGNAVWSGIEVPAACLVHGDPTFENLALDPMGGSLVLLDPIPQRVPALSIPDLDIAKVLQSAAGWEAFVRRERELLEVPYPLRPLITGRYGEQRWNVIVWLLVAHLIRTLPYGANVGDATALLPSIRRILADLPDGR